MPLACGSRRMMSLLLPLTPHSRAPSTCTPTWATHRCEGLAAVTALLSCLISLQCDVGVIAPRSHLIHSLPATRLFLEELHTRPQTASVDIKVLLFLCCLCCMADSRHPAATPRPPAMASWSHHPPASQVGQHLQLGPSRRPLHHVGCWLPLMLLRTRR